MKTKPTIRQVKDAAEQACFYVNENGEYFRMNYCEEEVFCAVDENTGENFTLSTVKPPNSYAQRGCVL